jgi:peptide deformylase
LNEAEYHSSEGGCELRRQEERMTDSQTTTHTIEQPAQLLEVIRLGHPALRTIAEPVPEEFFASGRLHELGRALVHTMLSSEGVGLAAPQVAEPLRLFAFWVPAHTDEEEEVEPTLLVNPEIRPVGDELEEGWEGCLSIPGLRGLVPRYRRLKVKARGVDGEAVSFTADGFHSRVIQHEYDHLDGIVFVDRMRSTQSLAFDQEWERYLLSREHDDD